MATLVQVASVDPEVLHLGGLPHVALLADPWPRILGGIGAEAPALANLVGNILADQVSRPAIHRAIARGIDDDIGLQLGAILEDDAVGDDFLHIAMGKLDLAVDDARDDLGLAHGELEGLAAHELDEDRQLQLATALDLPRVGALRLQHADGDVADQLGLEALLDLVGGELGAASGG